MPSLREFAEAKLAALAAAHTRRHLTETFRTDGIEVIRAGRRLVSFCCNDYLNLTQHPAVKRAAIAAIERYGAGAGASRLVTGNHPLYGELERRLARLKSTEDALVFGSGYLANVAIIPALVGRDDLVLIDELAHSCLYAGAALSGAERQVFRHNSVEHLAELLDLFRPGRRNCLILTDRIFSMDGDLAPIAALADLARRYDAWLLADDAHGTGIMAPPSAADVPLQMGTLSKALGSYGGFLCAEAAVIDLLRSRARAFVYTTGLPPASVAAASAALDVIEAEPERVRRPLALARLFAESAGLPKPESQIVPHIVGTATAALSASQRLEEAGFLVTAIRPPTVPEGTARLRITFTAGHTEGQVVALAAAVRDLPRRAAA